MEQQNVILAYFSSQTFKNFQLFLGRKFNPAKLAIAMRTATGRNGERMFTKKDYLTGQQITSFWSRYASNRRANAATAWMQANLNEIRADEHRRDPNIPTEEDQILVAVSPEIDIT